MSKRINEFALVKEEERDLVNEIPRDIWIKIFLLMTFRELFQLKFICTFAKDCVTNYIIPIISSIDMVSVGYLSSVQLSQFTGLERLDINTEMNDEIKCDILLTLPKLTYLKFYNSSELNTRLYRLNIRDICYEYHSLCYGATQDIFPSFPLLETLRMKSGSFCYCYFPSTLKSLVLCISYVEPFFIRGLTNLTNLNIYCLNSSFGKFVSYLPTLTNLTNLVVEVPLLLKPKHIIPLVESLSSLHFIPAGKCNVDHTLSYLTNLTRLTIYRDTPSSFTGRCFSQLHKLVELSLECHPLIEEKNFTHLTNLKKLVLENNTTISESIIRRMTNLENLQLYNDSLLNESIKEYLPKMKMFIM